MTIAFSGPTGLVFNETHLFTRVIQLIGIFFEFHIHVEVYEFDRICRKHIIKAVKKSDKAFNFPLKCTCSAQNFLTQTVLSSSYFCNYKVAYFGTKSL